jgi:hypothetical protein
VKLGSQRSFLREDELQPFIRDDIGRICDQFTSATNVLVTPTARDLAAEIISAISEDPHPSWRIEGPQQLIDFQRRYLEGMPRFLQRVVESERIQTNRITAFDILHWLGRGGALESWLCLIPK